MRRIAMLSLSLAALAPLPAIAQVTPERAASLQQQVRDWVQSTLGPAVPLSRDPVAVAAAGDHFDVSASLAAGPDAPRITGKMTDAGEGRWAVDGIEMSSPSVFQYRLPPREKQGGVGGEATTTVTIGEQQGHMLVDPTFSTPSTSTSTFKDFDLTTKLPNDTQKTHIASSSGSSTLTPAADGRLDLLISSSANGYSTKTSDSPERRPIMIAMDKIAISGTLTGLSRERGAELLRLALQAGQSGPGKPTPDRMDGQTALAFITALSDLATAFQLTEEVNGLTVSAQDMTGTLSQVSLGLNGGVEAGKLNAQLPLAVGGLTLPDLGLGTLATLVPSRLALTPTVSAVPASALKQLFRRALEKQEPTQADIAALFGDGPINAGINDLQLEVAGSTIAGSMKLLVASPSSFSGVGQISAENIDRLQQAMMADPQSAQIAPLLIFLKGIGRTEQNRTVWDVVYTDGRLTVNGQDMAALMGAVAPRHAPTQPPSGAPSRNAPRTPSARP